jgi:hypothetical protein
MSRVRLHRRPKTYSRYEASCPRLAVDLDDKREQLLTRSGALTLIQEVLRKQDHGAPDCGALLGAIQLAARRRGAERAARVRLSRAPGSGESDSDAAAMQRSQRSGPPRLCPCSATGAVTLLVIRRGEVNPT